MYQIVSQTRDEKLAMYMKLTKRELAEMLVNCNALLGREPSVDHWLSPPVVLGSSIDWYRARCRPSNTNAVV